MECCEDQLRLTASPARLQAYEVPKGRGSGDVGVWTVASHAEHANEMDTPELHRTSIMSAALAADHGPKHVP